MPPNDYRVLFFGDSYVHGINDPDGLGWSGRLMRDAISRGFGITYYNLGIRRNTSIDIVRRFPTEARERISPNADNVLVFSYGVNDTFEELGRRRVTLIETLSCTEALLFDASILGRRVFVGPPAGADPAQNSRLEELCAAFENLMTQRQVPYIDIFRPLSSDTRWLDEISLNDGYHPGSYGYTLIADIVTQSPQWPFRKSDDQN